MRDALAAAKLLDLDDAARGLLDGALDRRRDVWTERLLLTALWARAVKAGQPPPLAASKPAITWRDLVVLAHAVQSGRPLRDIPMMVEIAERTVAAVRSGGW